MHLIKRTVCSLLPWVRAVRQALERRRRGRHAAGRLCHQSQHGGRFARDLARDPRGMDAVCRGAGEGWRPAGSSPRWAYGVDVGARDLDDRAGRRRAGAGNCLPAAARRAGPRCRGWITATLLVVPIATYSYERGELHFASWLPHTARQRIILWGYTAEQVPKACCTASASPRPRCSTTAAGETPEKPPASAMPNGPGRMPTTSTCRPGTSSAPSGRCC